MPPVEYFYAFAEKNVLIEKFENYQKQSYRNRTLIYAPNGPQNLIIPIVRSSSSIITDIQIDYKTDWQRNHWRSITAAYNNSPYFLFYQDFFEPFYTKNYKFLFDFNVDITSLILKLLKWDDQLNFTSSYALHEDHYNDLRDIINPKNVNSSHYPFSFQNNYKQVFEEKFGFIPYLSILDLICNEGPNSGKFIVSNVFTNE